MILNITKNKKHWVQYYRGCGIGSSIAYQLTDGLLNQGHTRVRLMTDASNPSSNRAFQKIGFVKEGEYVVRYKEK